MALTKQDLQAIGKVMDEKLDKRLSKFADRKEMKKIMIEVVDDRLLNFSEKVIEPVLDNLAEDLGGRIDNLDRKMIRIIDNHSERLDKLNRAVFA